MSDFEVNNPEESASPEQGTAINPAYAKYDGMSLRELGEAMVQVRAQLDAAKAEATRLEKEYKFITAVKIPPALEESGMKNFRLASGKGIRVQDETYVSLRAENFDRFKDFLIEQGDEGIVKETIHSATLKSYITNRIKEGKEYPADLLALSIVPTARFF